MTSKTWLRLLLIVCIGSFAVYEVAAKEPVFLSWLVENDPGDQTIREYWERFEKDELSSDQMIDLGTMLFYRGYPRDAITLYKAALSVNKKQYEPWFRIGLVEHQQGNFRQARTAYKKSLDLFKGQGWCNFYLGLLEEHEGNSQKAMKYYQNAFRYAPELAISSVNPEMESSELSLGAWLLMTHQQAFQKSLPMPFMEPGAVRKAQVGHGQEPPAGQVKETPAETAEPNAGDRQEKGELKPPADSGAAVVPIVVPKGKKSTKKVTGVKANRGESRSGDSSKPKPTPKPKQTPRPVTDDDLPYGLPSNHNVSPEAYPGF